MGKSPWYFGVLLRETRQATIDPRTGRQVSLETLAQALSMSHASLDRLEKGVTPPSQRSFQEVNDLLVNLPLLGDNLTDLVGAYVEDCLTVLATPHRTMPLHLKQRFSKVLLSVLVDLWTTANRIPAQAPNAVREQFKAGFLRAVSIEKRTLLEKPAVLFSNPYPDLLLADQLAPVITELGKKFNVISLGPSSALSEIDDLDLCWAVVLVVSTEQSTSEVQTDLIERAQQLNIPVIGLYTDSSLALPNDESVIKG